MPQPADSGNDREKNRRLIRLCQAFVTGKRARLSQELLAFRASVDEPKYYERRLYRLWGTRLRGCRPWNKVVDLHPFVSRGCIGYFAQRLRLSNLRQECPELCSSKYSARLMTKGFGIIPRSFECDGNAILAVRVEDGSIDGQDRNLFPTLTPVDIGAQQPWEDYNLLRVRLMRHARRGRHGG